jgi:hypothetical protein
MIHIQPNARSCQKDHGMNTSGPVQTLERAYSVEVDRCPRA